MEIILGNQTIEMFTAAGSDYLIIMQIRIKFDNYDTESSRLTLQNS